MEEERDTALEELFRDRLEENEITAGDELSRSFMRRLDRIEFLRFNPARFNIWYIAAAAAALTMVGVLLLRSPDNTSQSGSSSPEEHPSEKTLIRSIQLADPDNQSDGSVFRLTGTVTAAGAERAETAPDGVIERHNCIYISSHEENNITIFNPEKLRLTLPLTRLSAINANKAQGNPAAAEQSTGDAIHLFRSDDREEALTYQHYDEIGDHDGDMFIRFPNAFVPNEGGPTGGYYSTLTDIDNQVFHPVASGVDSYHLKVYSKAGLLVFESHDIGLGWDGWYQGRQCAPGVYVWQVSGTFRDGRQIMMAGDVTLIRY